MSIVLICLLIISINFIFLYKLSGFFVGKGSDHAFYDYYIQLIKENKNRFFTYFPNFLNKTPITDPQFFFRFLSYFSTKQKQLISLLLNPIVLTILFIMVFILINPLIKYLNNSLFVAQLLLLIALTPQYFHGQNSRIYGLSARGVGLVLFFAFMILIYFYEQNNSYINFHFLLAVFLGYLIWGVSLFAQQAILFFSILFLLVFQIYSLFVATIFSILLFLILHPSYSKNYLINRWSYLIIYAKYLADRFILKHRYSVWRDWFYDFWFKKEKKITTKFSYIYTNSLFIIIFLNPFVPIALYGYFNQIQLTNEIHNRLYLFAMKVNIVGIIIFILTSLRITRFLGEPERYIEIIIPFSTIAGIITLTSFVSDLYINLLIIIFIMINVVQLLLFVFLRKSHTQDITILKDSISDRIDVTNTEKLAIKFFSNNQDWTKFFLNTKWNFIYFYPTVYEIGGIHITELIKSYPYFNSKGVLQIVKSYKINYCLIDSNSYVEIVDLKQIGKHVEEIMTETRFTLYKINW
jgi:hypothetical protein